MTDPSVCPECGADADEMASGWDARLTESGYVPLHNSPYGLDERYGCNEVFRFRCDNGHDSFYQGDPWPPTERVDEPDEWTEWGRPAPSREPAKWLDPDPGDR